MWRQYFASGPDVLGQTMTLHSRLSPLLIGQSVEIVGVMPDAFEDPAGYFEFWIPLGVQHAPARGDVTVLGRLQPGVSVQQATEEATAVFAAIREAAGSPGADEPRRMTVTTLKTAMVRDVRPGLQILFAAVALVLVIVCANVACLLLARGSGRQREIAVRLAIGGSRGRIVRQLLTESLVLAAAGGVVGTLVGAAGVTVLRALAVVEAPGVFRFVFGGTLLPRAGEITIDTQMLMMAVGLAAATSVLFGLAPALQASREDVRQATSARTGRAAEEGRLRDALVVGQLTMATVLLIGSVLLIRSVVQLADVEMGYDPDGVLAFQLVLPEEEQSTRKVAVIEDVLARLRTMPGVEAAGFSKAGALVGVVDSAGYFVPAGRSLEEMRQEFRQPYVRSMSGGYFAAMGIPVIAGRTFNDRDSANAAPVAMINRVLAQQLFGDANPVVDPMARRRWGYRSSA